MAGAIDTLERGIVAGKKRNLVQGESWWRLYLEFVLSAEQR